MDIQLVTTEVEIAACYPVLAELRPQLVQGEFVGRVVRQQREGFELACVRDGGSVVAVAGFRVFEKLFTGRSLYVDDLVTSQAVRSRGFGHALLGWLVEIARERGCAVLELDSGVQRHEAHRFYFRERLAITSHHFALSL